MYSATLYQPTNATTILGRGSTAIVWKHATRPKVVIKAPVERCRGSSEDGELQMKFSTEAQIFEILGEHRNIMRYLGLLDPSKPVDGILFEEASNGDLQKYLNTHGDRIDGKQRLQWCQNAAEGLSYCHKLGILHCDLRPDNLLVDEDLNIRFCDFGGSTCGELDGGGLPDFGFFGPRDEDVYTVSESMEVFGLGSIMYSIMTGHRPHGPSGFTDPEELITYGATFEDLLRRGIFPDTKDFVTGEIILECWTRKINFRKRSVSAYSTSKGILDTMYLNFKQLSNVENEKN